VAFAALATPSNAFTVALPKVFCTFCLVLKVVLPIFSISLSNSSTASKVAPAKAPFATLPVSLSSFFTLSKSFFKRPRALGVTSAPKESFSTVLLLTPVFLRAPAAPLTFALPS